MLHSMVCQNLIVRKRVLMVPERGFNCEKPDHFRIVYLPRPSVLKEAMGGLREFLETYHQ